MDLLKESKKYNNNNNNNSNNNNNTFVERHSAVASEALAEQVSQLYAVLNK